MNFPLVLFSLNRIFAVELQSNIIKCDETAVGAFVHICPDAVGRSV